MKASSCINVLLTLTQHEVYRVFAERLSSFGITPRQYSVLSCLWENGVCTPKEISQALRLDTSTISALLDRMQKAGFIDRKLAVNDKRNIQVVATKKGLSIQDNVLQTIATLNDELLSCLSLEQRKELIMALQKLVE